MGLSSASFLALITKVEPRGACRGADRNVQVVSTLHVGSISHCADSVSGPVARGRSDRAGGGDRDRSRVGQGVSAGCAEPDRRHLERGDPGDWPVGVRRHSPRRTADRCVGQVRDSGTVGRARAFHERHCACVAGVSRARCDERARDGWLPRQHAFMAVANEGRNAGWTEDSHAGADSREPALSPGRASAERARSPAGDENSSVSDWRRRLHRCAQGHRLARQTARRFREDPDDGVACGVLRHSARSAARRACGRGPSTVGRLCGDGG